MKYKHYVNSARIIERLQQVQQRQAARPQAARAASLVTQAVAAIRAAK